MATITGTNGVDVLTGTADADEIDALGGADTVYAQAGADVVHGGDARDTLRGGAGNDTLRGDGDKDQLYGEGDDDTLIGGAGQDRLSGGSGSDTFVYLAPSDSTIAEQDIVLDFAQGQDLIDLSGLAGTNGLAWAGTEATAAPYSVWCRRLSGNTLVYADVTGDTTADFRIQVIGTFTFTPADFLLGERSTGGDTPPDPVDDGAVLSEDGLPLRSGIVVGLVVSGNVLSNDTGSDLGVSAVQFGATPGVVGAPLAGTYGSLTLNADGSYTYVLDNDSPAVQSLPAAVEVQEPFTYTASNAWGEAEATLTFFIFGADEGTTSLAGTHNGETLVGTALPDEIIALGGADLVNAQDGADVVHGGDGADTLDGQAHDDQLYGDDGDDTLIGDDGADRLTGGPGRDTFHYETAGDSTPSAPDVILDFVPGSDRIDLLDLLDGTELAWGGTTPRPQSVWYRQLDGDTYVAADVTGDATADLEIRVTGLHPLVQSDFLGVVQPDGGGTPPQPADDSAAVAEDDVLAAAGNVLSNDGGPDLTVAAVRFGATAGTVGAPLGGMYGQLTLRADGGYDYTLDNASAAVQSLATGQFVVDVFTYTASNSEGDVEAALTVTVSGEDEPLAIIVGTGAGETLTGTNSAELIHALGGADTVNALGGADTVFGGDARDTLNGGDGDDTLHGEGDKDQLSGDAGNDTLIGGAGQDRLRGGAGNDVFAYLAPGDSTIAEQDVILDFTKGADRIDLGGLPGPADLAWGAAVATPNGVWLRPSGGNTYVYVDLTGDTNADFRIQVIGSVEFAATDFLGVVQPGGAGAQTVPGDDTASLTQDDVQSAAGTGEGAIASLLGTDNGETLTGTAGPDVINARGGGDNVNGLDGADTIYGGAGGDTLRGGDGDDVLFGEGDKYQDQLFGDAGNDTLTGGSGQDWLRGGAGNDVFAYLAPGDSTFAEQDVILDFVQGEDRIDLTGLLGTANLAWGGTTATPYGLWFGESGGQTMLYVDLTGNTSADFRIQVKGIHTLTPADFLGVSQASGGSPLPVGDVTSVAADVLLQTSGNVLANDGGTGLAVTGVSFGGTPGTVGAPLAGTYGALTLNADGTCTFALDNDSLTVQSLAAGQVAQDVFTYAVGNDNGSSEAAITVTIVGWNDDPTAADASVATGEDTPLTSTLPAATDVDGDAVDYFLGSAAGHGTAVVHTDGSFSYTPNAGFNGADTFVYGVSDAFGGLNLYTVTVDVGDRENPAAITGADAMTIAGSGVSNPDWTSFAEVQAATSQVGADAVIDLGNGNTIMLVGVTAANLTAADFVL